MNIIKALGLSLMLASAVTFSQPAIAQNQTVTPTQITLPAEPILLSQNSPDEEFQKYANSKYTYWDAKVLADFWGDIDVFEAKKLIGRKLLWGGASAAYLEQLMVDSRVKALGRVENLSLYSLAGYTYDDAVRLAEFWGDPGPYESKLRIERNLILGNEEVVSEALRMAGKP